MAEQIRSAVDQFIDTLHRLEKGDEGMAAEMAALFSDDARLENPALQLAGEQRRGQQGARHFWSEYRRTFKQAHSDFHQITTNDRAAGLFWTTRATGTDGHALEYDGASLLVFDGDGKITHFRGYYDTRILDRQMDIGVPEHEGQAQQQM